MGCATSKKKERLCYNCQGPCSPQLSRRSYSVHHCQPPPCSSEVHHHLVSLTSSSLEPFKVESFHKTELKIAPFDDDVENRISDEKRVSLIDAKMWSKMIDERIPKILPRTPIRTPPGEPENINAWELMEGLEDVSPLRPVNHFRSFSFHFGHPDLIRDENGGKEEFFSKPMWLELANRETDSKSLEFDPSVISTFREVLDLPNEETLENKGDSEEEIYNGEEIMVSGEDLEKEGKGELFEREKNSVESVFEEGDFKEEKKVKNKVVLYFTSLRGVRKTFEDCCHVRVILKSIGVKIDERDVSMHSGFKEELKELLGDKFSTCPLPRIFFGDNYIGGADEIRQMHEEGRLERMLLDGGDVAGDLAGVCEACGDVRFVPCERCYGSCKIYYGDEYEFDYEDDDDEYEAKEFDENDCGFQRCPCCNENGLVRCPICCD